jgi:hypothetical protein
MLARATLGGLICQLIRYAIFTLAIMAPQSGLDRPQAGNTLPKRVKNRSLQLHALRFPRRSPSQCVLRDVQLELGQFSRIPPESGQA